MASDREAVVWTRIGNAPAKMGRLMVTDSHCRFTYDTEFIASGLPGLGVLYAPDFIGATTIAWERTAHFDLLPQLQSLIPPQGESNFQRRLVLSYLQQQGITPAPGFDSDWAILMVAGHGGIGHLDVFANDAKAAEWYADKTQPALFRIGDDFGFSLKGLMTWMDGDAEAIIGTLGPTPSVGGAIPKLLLSIPASGWDGWIGLPRKRNVEGRTDVILKFESGNYPGIVALEALTLDLHRAAGLDVPRHWTTSINGVPAMAIERYDRTAGGAPLCVESLYAALASGDRRITHHYSSSYDSIGHAIDRSPIPIVSDPRAARLHLLQRLLLAFATGNGDLHLENLALVRRDTLTRFSPVYDPTPMRAYNRHDMLCVMPFGDYGEVDGKNQPIDLPEALRRLAKNLTITKKQLRGMIEEVLTLTATYAEQVTDLANLPDANKQHLVAVVRRVQKDLLRV
jgi:serine/threonine-protein kinase HipA